MASHAAAHLIRRSELVRDQLDHPPLGTKRLDGSGTPVRAGISGSGDALLVLAWSAKELERERAAGVRLFTKLGIGAGTRVANALPGALATPGSLMLGDVVQDLGGLDIPVGAVDNEAAAKQAWTLIDLVEPEVIILNPSSGTHLFAAAPSQPRSWWKGIVWLRTDGSRESPPPLRATTAFSGWQRTWLAVPEVTSFVAVSCSAARFHLDSAIVAEAVDAQTGRAMSAGEWGDIALTPIESETTIERYLSAFRGRVTSSACRCGVGGPALELESN